MDKINARSENEAALTAVEHQLAAPDDASEETSGQEQMPSQESPATPVSLEKMKAERDALLDRFARSQAEFENTRKRLAKEQDEFKDRALVEAMNSLLPILDSFDWALATPHQNVEEFRSGINLIRKQLQNALGKLGLRPIPAKGEPFDPRLHEAVEVVNTTAAQDNHVLEDLRRGYKLKDHLLRPAMVLVARNPEDGVPEESAERR
jgi:molecular chaperone GrpE